MSDTDDKNCPARTLYDGGEVTCDRDAGHAGVHLGKSIAGLDSELHQWTDARSIGDDDSGPVDELPVWYTALPIGARVRVGYRDDRDRLEGELTGAVLDDHEQLAAVRVNSGDRHVLIPWGNVALLSWAVDQ